MELRCGNKLHCKLDGIFLEVSCQSKFCGKQPGIVVLHRFNVQTGELIDTRRFADPVKEKGNGARNRLSVRHS